MFFSVVKQKIFGTTGIMEEKLLSHRQIKDIYRHVHKTCVKRSLKNRQNKDLNDKW